MIVQSLGADYTYDLLDRSGALLGTLDGVQPGSGQITRSAAASIKASASLTLTDRGQVDSWLNVRIRPVITLRNGDSWPLGVFLPDAPEQSLSDLSRTMTVNLLDKTTILDGDSFGTTYGIAAGSNVTGAVRDVITSTGEPPVGIEDSDQELRSGIEWEPDATKLQVVNDLLSAGNFFSLYTSGTGGFRADPYVRPADRAPTAEFVDGESVNLLGVYLPEFVRTHDIGRIPNRVRVVSQATGDEEALTAEATNTDPGDPFSFVGRGFWITHVESSVDTTGQSALDAYARRRLIELSEPQETVTIGHPPSRVTINDTVTFVSRTHGIDGLWTVTKQEWSLAFKGMVTSTLRRVVDL